VSVKGGKPGHRKKCKFGGTVSGGEALRKDEKRGVKKKAQRGVLGSGLNRRIELRKVSGEGENSIAGDSPEERK